jgi:methylmalonyl-CoA mutase cobalamin-binding subunit
MGVATTGAGAKRLAGTASVAKRMGRKPRILVAKMGQDGHDGAANWSSSARSATCWL